MASIEGSFPANRRQFLVTSACLAATAASPGSLHADRPAAILLEPRGRDLFRVRMEMEVEGNVNLAKNALVARKTAMKLPIKSEATFDYEERYRRPEGTDAGEVTFVERFYHEATSQGELNRNRHVATLRESVRQTIVRRETSPEVIYAADDYFHRDELDLLRLPVSSVAVDQLLPTERVTVGSTYSPTRESLLSAFNLTSVEASDITAEVVMISDEEARIQFRGKLDGSVDGVPTTLRTVGKLTFDRQLGACTWLAVAVHETREIGLAEPGFDIAATIKMLRKPLEQPIALESPPRPVDLTDPIPEDRLYVEIASDQLGFNVLMDRQWRMISDIPGSAVMRMIDTDRSIAQCDLRALATLPAGSQWTLEAFQQDIRRTLGEQLNDLIEAEEFLSHAGLRVLRVVARGSVQGVPIQWVMLHFSDDSGRRLLGTFTMEGQNVASFAGADTQLAGTLRFLQTNQNQGEAMSAEASPPEASPPEASPRPDGNEVARALRDQDARARRDEDADEQVQSASDLR